MTCEIDSHNMTHSEYYRVNGNLSKDRIEDLLYRCVSREDYEGIKEELEITEQDNTQLKDEKLELEAEKIILQRKLYFIEQELRYAELQQLDEKYFKKTGDRLW